MRDKKCFQQGAPWLWRWVTFSGRLASVRLASVRAAYAGGGEADIWTKVYGQSSTGQEGAQRQMFPPPGPGDLIDPRHVAGADLAQDLAGDLQLGAEFGVGRIDDVEQQGRFERAPQGPDGVSRVANSLSATTTCDSVTRASATTCRRSARGQAENAAAVSRYVSSAAPQD